MSGSSHSVLPVSLFAVVLMACGASQAVGFDDPPGQAGLRSAPDMRASLGRPDATRGRAQDSMSDSVRRIERSTRGRVLSVERMHSDGRDLNRIKVMDDSGRVRVYVDDPQQRGRSMRARGDDD